MAPSWETRTTCLKRYLDEARIMHLWDTEGEQDPIWDFQNAVLIGEHVVDLVCQYLGYQAYLSCATEVSTVVVPPSIFHAVISIHDPGDVHQIVWTPHHPPSRIVLPVVDLAQTHCYLWYGDIEQKAGKTSITLRYLDSLGSPTPIHWRQRFDAVLKVVKYLFPGVDGPIQGEFRDLLGYRQSPGSVDCGIFVCQAVSAIVFDSQDALLDLLPVPVVRQGINRILVECKHGALEYLAAGRYSAKVTLLHKAIWPGHVALQGTSFTEDATTTAAMDSSFSLRRINSTAGTAELWSCPKEKQIRRLSSVPPSHLSNDKEETCSETNGLGAFPISRRATSALSGFSFVYGRSSAQRFPSTPEYHYESLFDDLNAQQSSWPQGKIANGGGRDPSLLLQAALLVDPTRRSRAQSGVSIVTCGGQGPVDDSESSDSINEYIAAIRDIKDPDPCAKVWAFLTGQVAGEQLVLDWLKDTVHPNEDWMDIAHDIDSLSLTVDEPEFSMPVAINAYPPRASTVTSDNGLRIWLDGRKRPLSHFLNFTCFTLGSNNQFRVNVFFPNYVVPRLDNSRYRTFMEAKDYEQWYDRVFICALERVSRKAPPNLRLAILQATTELPPTYASAQAHAHMADGSRNFAGYKITHELLNLITPEMRKIVNTTDDLAKFRGYFFHIWGTNLKTVGQSIQGRSSDNPLLHIFRTYPIVPWQKQNPQDIFVDFAVEVYIDPDRLPADLPYVTLLWNSPVMAQLMGSTYLSTQHDAYMHSHVIGGLRAFTTGLDGHSIVKFQCYHKDMKQTYIHGDNSLGTGFSPQDALGSTKRYFTQVLKLSNAWSYRSSFGSRAEWRANAWAAYQMLQRDPSEWLTRFLEAGAIVVHPTVSVYNLKTYALMLLRKSISLQQQLSLKERSLEEVQLLALVTTYLIKGLVKRPDDMSSSRTMANRLQLIQRAVRYGFPTLQPHMLSDCVTRITGQVEKEEWSILNFLRCKKPGGARLKTSFSSKPAAMQLPSLSSGPRNLPHVLPTRPSMTLSVSDVIGSQLNNADMEWSRRFINERLSTWLWGRFPEHHLRANIDRSTCFNGPWRLSGWRKVAAEDIRLGFRKKARKDFQEIVEELFPMDWIRTGPEGQWRTYQECILDRVRHKIVRRGAPDTQRFALQLREALQHHLHTWEYLPATQKQKVWVLQNPEAPWTYMLHKNPHVVHD
ncbi:hypothetical protein FRC07_007124 [Ceratobasidium sp. 392]|nr:hypothetical protein FRC07_007124 [Ceratobasidium sp. 392]